PAVEHCDAGEGKLYQGKYSWPNMIDDEENCGDAISDWEEGLYHGATHLSGNSEKNICGQLPPIFKDNAMPWFNETTLEHEQTCIFDIGCVHGYFYDTRIHFDETIELGEFNGGTMVDCVRAVEKTNISRAVVATFDEKGFIQTCSMVTDIGNNVTEWILKEEEGAVSCFLKDRNWCPEFQDYRGNNNAVQGVAIKEGIYYARCAN
ncbi:uncharacterized protein LOC142356064, partial [Convolutriloba macropyga]|uniref:uncharacterized protein LOC142356064 n=1 Tax=Convolutriloba macropyga TaxID=536237 RepID=UPI003F52518F